MKIKDCISKYGIEKNALYIQYLCNNNIFNISHNITIYDCMVVKFINREGKIQKWKVDPDGYIRRTAVDLLKRIISIKYEQTIKRNN